MLSGEYPVDKARALCFSHLYKTVVVLANAIMKLVEESYINAPFVLLRSAMEAFATCYYISERLASRQTICHDYIVYSFLMAEYNVKSKDAKLRQQHKMKTLYPEEHFVLVKQVLKEHFKAFPHPLAWLDPNSREKSMSTAAIIEAADKKYAKLYHLGNLEVHSNYAGTQWYAVLSHSIPRRPIPIVAWGEDHFFKSVTELEFDFLVAEIVICITGLAPRFLPPTDSFAQRATILAANGNCVLEKLVGN